MKTKEKRYALACAIAYTQWFGGAPACESAAAKDVRRRGYKESVRYAHDYYLGCSAARKEKEVGR